MAGTPARFDAVERRSRLCIARVGRHVMHDDRLNPSRIAVHDGGIDVEIALAGIAEQQEGQVGDMCRVCGQWLRSCDHHARRSATCRRRGRSPSAAWGLGEWHSLPCSGRTGRTGSTGKTTRRRPDCARDPSTRCRVRAGCRNRCGPRESWQRPYANVLENWLRRFRRSCRRYPK